ncbi:hypothetical protein GGQ80_000815 [Sphingomonas jinjuensis]|uniref:Uncharacterized protein n=1 Tax=Sphingomonas jinjuensis TaxID=535907 RepID=A0A840FBK8_9SPHN|nr:hypothetical protein [Sphingomonas jinjuensis]MBB4152927.1 hypothetical protein [Sphingomonas jinjuensis]
MTLERDPLTMENELNLVLGEIGMERAAAITGRAPGYLRNLSHPDRREQLTARDMFLLDIEHDARFGRGYPLFEALGRQLQTARAARFADSAAIAHHSADLARENGEAIGALIAAGFAPGDDKALAEALRQVEDVHRVASAAMATIHAALGRTADPPPVPP